MNRLACDSIHTSAFWLGMRDGNITFQDSLDFDLTEIDSVYDDGEGDR